MTEERRIKYNDYQREYQKKRYKLNDNVRKYRIEYNKKYREENNEKIKKDKARWVLNNPEKVKTIRKKWNDMNKEKIKLYGKIYKENHRYKTKKRRLRLRIEILEKYNFTCQYCGRKVPDVSLEIDHIYPKSKGGKNEINNYTVACRDCNLGKGDYILKEFL